MKVHLKALIIGLAVVPGVAAASDLKLDSTTLVDFHQQSAPGFEKNSTAAGIEYFGLNINAGNGLFLHLYGWGSTDFNNGINQSDLSTAYIDYRFPKSNALIRAGRFFVSDGVLNDQIDGGSVAADLKGGFRLSLYGGAPVRHDRDTTLRYNSVTDNTDVLKKGSYITGASLRYHLPNVLELSVSGVREGNMVVGPDDNVKDRRELVGADAWVRLLPKVEASGKVEYNTVIKGLADQRYSLVVKPLDRLTVSGEFNDYQFQKFFAFTTLPELFNNEENERMRSYGGAASYRLDFVTLTGTYKYYDRAAGTGDRYGANARFRMLDGHVITSVGYNRVNPAPTTVVGAINSSYDEYNAYVEGHAGRMSANVYGLVHHYTEPVFNRTNEYSVSGSLGVDVAPGLNLSGDIVYSQNPRLNEEVRGFLRLKYTIAVASKGETK